MKHCTLCALVFALVVLVSVPDVSRASKSGSLAAELARLRAEVETLSSRLQDKKEAFRSQRRLLAMKKANLALSLQRARLRLSQLSRKKKQLVTLRKKSAASQKALVPIVFAGLKSIRARVRAGLPFRLSERVAVLDKLRARLKGGLLKPKTAASRLWQFVEDELRLSRENGLYRQTIKLQGKTLLVEVARVGMVMLFFKTRDGRFGKAVHKEGKWKFVLLRQERSIAQVATLFDALKKQIRVGFWKLPNTLKGGKRP